ncbi:hypothetical protein EWM64_g7871 [Hericium alpestre]|uniref:DSC E3 ubiquitin ligase complex subunit 3 C-terminal domain-containing protein n=1 Tax=Hericium alpestre TaxID=135208 RepID=A0A4Y9ZQN3_9AGAM|nr:hypothetical protein EWM64_g7871 [Hericium alpestre]
MAWLHCSVGRELAEGEEEEEEREPQTAQIRPLRGFDRLTAAGFSPADIVNFRRQFHMRTSEDYLSMGDFASQEEYEEYARNLEEQWIDSLDNVGTAAISQSDPQASSILEGIVIGFFFPLLPFFFFRDQKLPVFWENNTPFESQGSVIFSDFSVAQSAYADGFGGRVPRERPDLPQAPWVLAPGETAISRVPRYLAKSGKVQIRQAHALTVTIPDTYPFAPELAVGRNGSKRYRISWFVITAPSGVRLTALLAAVGNVWVERTQDGGRVWICDWPGRWTEWQGTRMRHPMLPGMQFYFAGREWRWDDGDRIVKHQLSAWKRGMKALPEAALAILWGENWRAREDAREDRPLPTPVQTVKVWELYQGLPCRLWGGVTRRIQAPRPKSGRVLQRVPAAPSASEQSRQAPGVQAPPWRVDEDDASDIDCQVIEEMLCDQGVEVGMDEDEHQLDRVTTASEPSPNKDATVTEHHPPPSLATSVAQRLAEAGTHLFPESLEQIRGIT